MNRRTNQQGAPHPPATHCESEDRTPTFRYIAPNPGQPHPQAFNDNLHTSSGDGVNNDTWPDVSTLSQNPTGERSPCHIICIGNPGVGKSTILNTIIGTVEFPSGPSFVSGLTKRTARVERLIDEQMYTLVDTPGLDDLHGRQEAARQISHALSVSETRLRILFIATLEAGRVRASDLATLDTVVTALDNAGLPIAGRFSLLINKCEQSVYEALEDYDQAQKILSSFNYICHVAHIGKIANTTEANRAPNTKLLMQASLRKFAVDAPEVETFANFQISVPVDLYERRKQQLTLQILVLQNALSRMSYRLTGDETAWRERDPRASDDRERNTPVDNTTNEIGSEPGTGDAGAWGNVMRFATEWLQVVRTHGLRVLGLD